MVATAKTAPCKNGAQICEPWERDWSNTKLQPGDTVGETGTVHSPSATSSAPPKPADAVPVQSSTARHEEVVTVKYRGPVSLAPFKCDAVTRSSFIERVCYDAPNSYMLIELNGTWYHYCEIDADAVSGLMAAESMGHFYNASIKGQFDCRTHRAPQY